MVIAGTMFDDDTGAYLRLGFGKVGFAERLKAWAETFEKVKLPGQQ